MVPQALPADVQDTGGIHALARGDGVAVGECMHPGQLCGSHRSSRVWLTGRGRATGHGMWQEICRRCLKMVAEMPE